MTAVRSGDAELAKLGIKGVQVANPRVAGELLLRRLEELSVGPAVEVLLNVSLVQGTLKFRTMDGLSNGPWATVLLLRLIGASTADPVLDQLADDLDNRLVYDGVVAHLRTLKGFRQVIASTHKRSCARAWRRRANSRS
jgi:hypothetical protein